MKRKVSLFLALVMLVVCAMPMAAFAATVVVDTETYTSGILRAKPDFEAKVVEYLKNGTSVEVTDTLENWYAVKTEDGITGYMHESVLSMADVSNKEDVYTLDKAANLRAEPSSDAEYVRGVDKGVSFLLIERGVDWSRVIVWGKTGYIHNSTYTY